MVWGVGYLTKDQQSKVWWTEDVAEMRNAVYNAYSHVPEKRDRLIELLNELYEIVQTKDGYQFDI